MLARQDITIKSADTNDLPLSVDPPIQLTGHLIVEGAEGVAPSGITMYLTALENPTGPTQFAYIDTDGSFEFRDPFPEQYALNIPRLPAGMYVKSVLFNGQNVKSQPIDLSHGGGEMKVILRSGTAEVSGSVPGQSRMMIALLPVQVGADGSGVVNVVANGSEFEMKNVPPGGYHAYAFDDAAIKRYYLPLQNPEVLKTITQYATALELQENERRSIPLTVVPFAAVQKAIMNLGLN